MRFSGTQTLRCGQWGLGAALLLLPLTAQAKSQPSGRLRGGQIDAVFGVSGCISGPSACSMKSGAARPAGPLFGTGINVGWRASAHFFVGAGYSLGFFGPGSSSPTGFNRAYQNSVLAVFRGYLPADRFDFGLELSPGWSRVSFKADANQRTTYSEGFVLRPGFSATYWISSPLFLGLRFDSLINMHRKVCEASRSRAICEMGDRGRRGSVSTFVAGIHIGGTFR